MLDSSLHTGCPYLKDVFMGSSQKDPINTYTKVRCYESMGILRLLTELVTMNGFNQ
jgi:hypothetical protein